MLRQLVHTPGGDTAGRRDAVAAEVEQLAANLVRVRVGRVGVRVRVGRVGVRVRIGVGFRRGVRLGVGLGLGLGFG